MGKRPQQEQDIEMHKIMQSTMIVSVTLEEILRCKPELWTQIHTWLKKEGKKGIRYKNLERKPEKTPRELCKLSQYVKTKSHKGSTTLKMEVNGVNNLWC